MRTTAEHWFSFALTFDWCSFFFRKVHKNIPTSWFIFILLLDYFSLSPFLRCRCRCGCCCSIRFPLKRNVILFRDVYGLLTFCTWAIVIRSTCNRYRPVERLYYFYGKERINWQSLSTSQTHCLVHWHCSHYTHIISISISNMEPTILTVINYVVIKFLVIDVNVWDEEQHGKDRERESEREWKIWPTDVQK